MSVTTATGHSSGVLADGLRVVALLSAVAVALVPTFPTEAAVRFALTFAALLVTRAIQLPRPFDAAFAALLLATGWASALGWYFEHPWVDVPIHIALTGATAAVLYFGVARAGLLPPLGDPGLRRRTAGIVLVVTLLGATVALLWEVYEWVAENVLSARILVGYDDTVLDMVNGFAGSVVAGVCVAWWARSGHGMRAEE